MLGVWTKILWTVYSGSIIYFQISIILTDVRSIANIAVLPTTTAKSFAGQTLCITERHVKACERLSKNKHTNEWKFHICQDTDEESCIGWKEKPDGRRKPKKCPMLTTSCWRMKMTSSSFSALAIEFQVLLSVVFISTQRTNKQKKDQKAGRKAD